MLLDSSYNWEPNSHLLQCTGLSERPPVLKSQQSGVIELHLFLWSRCWQQTFEHPTTSPQAWATPGSISQHGTSNIGARPIGSQTREMSCARFCVPLTDPSVIYSSTEGQGSQGVRKQGEYNVEDERGSLTEQLYTLDTLCHFVGRKQKLRKQRGSSRGDKLDTWLNIYKWTKKKLQLTTSLAC